MTQETILIEEFHYLDPKQIGTGGILSHLCCFQEIAEKHAKQGISLRDSVNEVFTFGIPRIFGERESGRRAKTAGVALFGKVRDAGRETQARMIKAILFDCDGTLVDTESQTGLAIDRVLSLYGIHDAGIPTAWTRGQTWISIAERIQRLYPVISDANVLAEQFTETWETLVIHAPPITGAIEAVREAALWFSLGMVTSSPNRSVAPLLAFLGIEELIPTENRVCAEHVTRSKPNPEGYLLAAQRFNLQPRDCLVFEDSEAGILAARSAGMYCIAVLQTTPDPKRCRDLADKSIMHFGELPSAFWSTLAEKSIDLLPAWP